MDLFFLFWAISLGIICGAGLYLLAGILSIVITISVFLLDYMQSPVALSLLVVHCSDTESGKRAEDVVKMSNCFARIKSKTVRKGNVEYIWEIKKKKETTLEDDLNSLDGVRSFSLMSFDRETRV